MTTSAYRDGRELRGQVSQSYLHLRLGSYSRREFVDRAPAFHVVQGSLAVLSLLTTLGLSRQTRPTLYRR